MPKKLTCYEFKPCDVRLDKLLGWCLASHPIDRILLIARFEPFGETGRYAPSVEVLASIERLFCFDLEECLLAEEWPGTKCPGSSNLILLARFDEAVLERMAAAGPYLSDWTARNTPPLPEDLCLFRQGSEWPVFFSSSHENLGWLISTKQPPFRRVRPLAIPTIHWSEHLNIPRTEYFCNPPRGTISKKLMLPKLIKLIGARSKVRPTRSPT